MAKVIGIDTCIFATVFSGTGDFFEPSKKILEKVQAAKWLGVFSGIGLIELLTGPKQVGDFDLAKKYKMVLTQFPHLKIVNLSEAIIDRASDLRALYKLSTPDAIHVATAIESGAEQFVTNDKALRKIKEIEVLFFEC